MRKRKALLLMAGMTIVASTFAITSCSTSWIHWKEKNDGGRSQFNFHHNQATPNQYVVRYHSLAEFETAGVWNLASNTLDFSKLNNHYELFEFFGCLTQLKYTSSINTNWKLDDWPKFVDYLKQIQQKTTINIIDQNIRFGSINIDFSADIAKILPAFSSYVPNPDTTRPVGVDGKLFDKAKKYDVEYHGLNSQNRPVDIAQVASAGAPLTNNPSVSALLYIDSQFALSLSTLVNLPIGAFDNFAALLLTLNNAFNAFINNQGFQNWVVEKNVDFNVAIDGKIPSQKTDLSTLFKGKMLETILK